MIRWQVKKHVQWDGVKLHGYVDIGKGIADDVNPADALVFMVVALNANWKLHVGYFLINGMYGSERANLVEQCSWGILGYGCRHRLVMALFVISQC